MSCGVGHRRGSNLAFLWLWHRPAATVPIGLLAWEFPLAAGAASEKTKRKKKRGDTNGNNVSGSVPFSVPVYSIFLGIRHIKGNGFMENFQVMKAKASFKPS